VITSLLEYMQLKTYQYEHSVDLNRFNHRGCPFSFNSLISRYCSMLEIYM